MSEWQPQVVRLEKVERHPNADTLEISTVLGGYVIVFQENQYKEGDLVSYIPVDSICPERPEFEWLGSKRRIKAIRLRGIFSLGITAAAPEGMKEGDSIVDHFGLTKYVYEEEVPDQVNTNNEHAPSGWSLPHYDLEALRKYSRLLTDNEEVVLTEKLEGCNAAFCHDGERLWVKSRNFFKKEDPLNQWWNVAERFDLKNKLAKYPGLAFFGELYGQVKGFKYDCPVVQNRVTTKIRFFDIFDTKTMTFLNWDEMTEIVKELGLEYVPVLHRGPWTGQDLWAHAEGKSSIGENIREGFVVRPVVERVDPRYGRIILKHKGEEYLLKKK